MQNNSEEIMEMLRKLKYQQHTERQVIAILESYPSLCERLQQCINEGARTIEIVPDHYLDKPMLHKVGDRARICINE